MSRNDPILGELRPSQVLWSFGVGAIVDLPNLSVLVMGLEDWQSGRCEPVVEPRLLEAVQHKLGAQVERLAKPPIDPDQSAFNRQPGTPAVGVPVAPFPRYMRCPACNLLAPLASGLFKLQNIWVADRACYVHENCASARKPPQVHPVRFLAACEAGHLDDFPWSWFVHGGQEADHNEQLQLIETSVTGEPAAIMIKCTACDVSRPLVDAFGPENRDKNLPRCGGRWPHLRDRDEQTCVHRIKPITLGASNSWFGVSLSALALPLDASEVDQAVAGLPDAIRDGATLESLPMLRALGQLGGASAFPDTEVWAAILRARERVTEERDPRDLRGPEWALLSDPANAPSSEDFQLKVVPTPPHLAEAIKQVVLVQRVREASALLGFTRIQSPNDFGGAFGLPSALRAPLSRGAPRFVPASEVRGEGLFLRFRDATLRAWEDALDDALVQGFRDAHRLWRAQRGIPDPDADFPGMRYVLLHTLSHALMRQLALECGYTAASIRERLYAEPIGDSGERMAGILLYTASPDSEGTLGGLVRLGEPDQLGRLLPQALIDMELCASDPLCAEHHPHREGVTLHGAACHACLFAPETSCERGNKYLDRTLLVETLSQVEPAFFKRSGAWSPS